MQEWKNILIRGNQQEDFAKYTKAFADQEKAVQSGLKKTLEALKKENDPDKAWVIPKLEQQIKNHADLGAAYRAALDGFDQADPEAGKKIDAKVKGPGPGDKRRTQRARQCAEKKRIRTYGGGRLRTHRPPTSNRAPCCSR